MGAIVDRLEITLQDAKIYLKLPLGFSEAFIDVLPDPPANTDFYFNVNGSEIRITTDADPTPAEISAAFVATGNTANYTIADFVGRYRLIAFNPPMTVFHSRGQNIAPLTPDEYTILDLIEVAKEMADDYCNNDFADLDSEGNIIAGTEEEIPAPVRTGVLQLLDYLYFDLQHSAAAANASGPVKEKKVGDISVKYATGTDQSRTDNKNAWGTLPALAQNALNPYRLMPGHRPPPRAARPHDFGLSDMADPPPPSSGSNEGNIF